MAQIITVDSISSLPSDRVFGVTLKAGRTLSR